MSEMTIDAWKKAERNTVQEKVVVHRPPMEIRRIAVGRRSFLLKSDQGQLFIWSGDGWSSVGSVMHEDQRKTMVGVAVELMLGAEAADLYLKVTPDE